MKKLLILGAGTGGTIMSNKLRKALPKEEWEITVVDQEKIHYYQPGFLLFPWYIQKRGCHQAKKRFYSLWSEPYIFRN
jgi:sulfide:quinone oxidoreductase